MRERVLFFDLDVIDGEIAAFGWVLRLVNDLRPDRDSNAGPTA